MSSLIRLAITGLVSLAALAAPVQANDPVGQLPGRWSGWGSVKLENGQSERVKCVATYFVADGRSSIKQNLRCASASYKIDVAANLKLSDGRLTGSWEEKMNSQTGSITGRVDSSGFNISVLGSGFSARMAVDTGACKQSITINPQGVSISRIAINLAKC